MVPMHEQLIAIRKQLSLTQQEMAWEIGMSLRAYQALEGRESSCRVIHLLAAERVALRKAAVSGDLSLLPETVSLDALRLAPTLIKSLDTV